MKLLLLSVGAHLLVESACSLFAAFSSALYVRVQSGLEMDDGKKSCAARITYYRGLNNYLYHFGVHLRYYILYLFKEYRTLILVIIEAPILNWWSTVSPP